MGTGIRSGDFARKSLLSLAISVCSMAVLQVRAEGETLYVQSQKIALKESPALSAADVQSLVRGDEVRQVEAQGVWLKVEPLKKGAKIGWVSKLFVNKNRPIGAALLAAEVPASEAKTSRRRESSYSVSASTRGLMPLERSRADREAYRPDMLALEKLEKLKLSPDEIDAFVREADPVKGAP